MDEGPNERTNERTMDTSTLYLTVDHPNIEIEQSLTHLYRNKANAYNDAHKNPSSASAYHDSGFDLFVPHTIRTDGVQNGSGNTTYDPITLDHHVRIASYASVNQYPRPYYLYPRSSISKTPFRLANSVGIIDAGYRGHVIAKVDDIRRFYGNTTRDRNEDDNDDAYASYYGEGNEDRNVILKGTRLFQVCSHNLLPFDKVVLLNKNDPRMQTDVSTRGEGGFGSTNLSFSG